MEEDRRKKREKDKEKEEKMEKDKKKKEDKEEKWKEEKEDEKEEEEGEEEEESSMADHEPCTNERSDKKQPPGESQPLANTNNAKRNIKKMKKAREAFKTKGAPLLKMPTATRERSPPTTTNKEEAEEEPSGDDGHTTTEQKQIRSSLIKAMRIISQDYKESDTTKKQTKHKEQEPQKQ